MLVPEHDTTRFLDEFRAAQLSHLLVAAVTEFDCGAALAAGPLSFDQLRARLKLEERPAIVLLTGLRAMGLLEPTTDFRLALTPYGREKLSPESPFHLRGYVGLGAFSADVRAMSACLRDDCQAGEVSFVYHEGGPPSALDDPPTSDALTRAMADRARSIAPLAAEQLDLAGARRLADIGGAHGLYSLALLRKFPELRAVILDRPPPLAVAREYAAAAGLAARVEFLEADVHTAELAPPADVVLLANLLHDYGAAHAAALVAHYARQLPTGGRLVILDSFLNPVPPGAPPVSDGPRAVAAYSALLFSICEGRCYRLDEYQAWLAAAGLEVDPRVPSLPAHGSLLTGWR